jgi:hypothetical protein
LKTVSRRKFIQSSALGLGSVLIFSGFNFQSSGTSGDFVIAKTSSGAIIVNEK